MAACRPNGCRCNTANTSSAFSATTPRITFPSLPISNGSIPNSSQAARTPSEIGIVVSSNTTPTFDFSANSFTVFARPPRVGSFAVTTPPAASTLPINPFKGAISDFTRVSNPYPSRNESSAIPCSPNNPEAINTSPRFRFASKSQRYFTGRYRSTSFRFRSSSGRRFPTPLVLIMNCCTAPRSTTLVSPVTIGTPALFATRAMDRTITSMVSTENPSSRMNPADNANGRAPTTDTSLIVPHTESDPISPPGKINGDTVCESVDNTTSSITAASSNICNGTSARP